MNVTEQYLLKQMQTLAATMSGVPQSGGSKNKAGESGSFQDLMNQIGKSSDPKENPKTPETKDAAVQEKTETAENEAAPAENSKQEELKP